MHVYEMDAWLREYMQLQEINEYMLLAKLSVEWYWEALLQEINEY